MNVARAKDGLGMQTVTDAQTKEQAIANATSTFQAKYGEKPKEARQIKKALDKDDFMRIMITEMKHQDPTKPMDSDRMATQMAQITSVEQLKNVGTAIDKLADKSSASDRLAMSAMIGKSVTVDKSRFAHQKGTLSPISFDLPADAQKIKLSILNEKGEEIATRELEPMKAGTNVYNWDGINASSIPSLTGSYMVRVDAEDVKGNKLPVNPISQETVVGISFEGGEANFLVGDSKNPQTVPFRSVTRISGDAPSRANVMMAKEVVGQQANAANGSSGATKAGLELPAGLQEKIKAQMMAQAAAVEQHAANNESKVSENPNEKTPAAKAEGFPNGLSD